MVPIAITDNRPFDAEGFKAHLLDLCKEHKQKNRALAFAFIVYDFQDYTISKILKDEDYWQTLDKLSGHYLSIFYVNSQNEYFKIRQQQIYAEEKARREAAAKKGYISFMTPLTLGSTPLEKTVEYIKSEFKIEDDITHPFVMFFQSDGKFVTDYFVVSIKNEKVEDAFIELNTIIKYAVDGIKNVEPENYANEREIFALLKGEVKSGKFYEFIGKKGVIKIAIGKVASMIIKLARF